MAHDPLTDALLAAGTELARDFDWCFEGSSPTGPDPDSEFVTVLRRHLTPLVDQASYLAARRDALLAELRQVDALIGAQP